MQEEIFQLHHSGYFVSNHGRIKGFKVPFLTPTLTNCGYHIVSLPLWRKQMERGSVGVHQVVYETFHGPIPEGKIINHKNGIKTDNFDWNLEAVTHAENTLHAYNTGLANGLSGEDNSQAKLSNEQFILICELLMEGATNQDISNMFGIHDRYVSLIRHKRRWQDKFPSWYIPSKSLGNTGLDLSFMITVYKECLDPYVKNIDIASKFSLDKSTVSRIRSGKTWIDFIEYYNTRIATTIPGGEVHSSGWKN